MLNPVTLIGLLFLAIGVSIAASPAILRKIIRQSIEYRWLWWIGGIRVLIGGILVFGATDTRIPGFILGLGILLVVAGVALPFLPEDKVDRMGAWWLSQTDVLLRGLGVLAAVLGAVVIWASR